MTGLSFLARFTRWLRPSLSAYNCALTPAGTLAGPPRRKPENSVNIQLKQRLVGAVVLVSLAVIIIPMLLPGEGSYTRQQPVSTIPAEPDYRFAPLPEPPPAPPVAQAPPVPVEALPAPVVEEPAKPETPAVTGEKSATRPIAEPVTKPDLPVDAATPKQSAVSKAGDGQATGWVVQVGSFSNARNARALRDRLRTQGRAAFVEAVKDTHGKPVYRVRVGPELRRDLAEKLQQRLARDAGLKGIVLRYP